jgi:XapX domain-containing protein
VAGEILVIIGASDLPAAVRTETDGKDASLVFDTVACIMFRRALACLALRGRLVEMSATGQREASFHLADFYHNESRLVGIDTLKRDIIASAQILDALASRLRVRRLSTGADRRDGDAGGGAPGLCQGSSGRDRSHCSYATIARSAMMGFFVSLPMGLAVGVDCGLSGMRSPVPPLIALAGLLGIVLGEQAVGIAKAHLFTPAAQQEPTEKSSAG